MRRLVRLGVAALALAVVGRIAATLGVAAVFGLRRANAEAIEDYVGRRAA